MGKRYHCEYCNKTFMDNLGSRKRHLTSLSHTRNRKAHYDSLRDPATILANEMAKKTPCREFLVDGDCKFGEICRFSHLTEDYKAELEHLVAEAKKNKGGKIVRHKVSDWLIRYEAKKNGVEVEPEPVKEKVEILVYELPASLQNMTNVPISLLPPPPSSFVDRGDIEEWGFGNSGPQNT